MQDLEEDLHVDTGVELLKETDAAQRRRVLMITLDFPPSAEPGARACLHVASYLPLYGWKPIVLTVRERCYELLDVSGSPAFCGEVVRTGMLPHPLTVWSTVSGKLRRGTGGGNGAKARSGRENVVRRWGRPLLTTPDTYTGWIAPASVAGLRLIRRRRVDHLFSSAPCWTNHLVGLILSRVTRIPWTVHLRDPWVPEREPNSMGVLSARIERALERMVLRQAASVVCVTERHTSLLRQTFRDVPPAKFVTIPNGYDEAEWVHVRDARADRTRADKFTITYAGTLYMARNPQPLFCALRELADAGDISQERIQVDLIGWCDTAEGRRVTDMAADHGLGRCVRVMEPLSRPELLRRMARSDLLLLLAEGLTLQIPSKTYEYLRLGRPILALTSDGALADLLRQVGGAWVLAPTDRTGIVAAVREAYRAWKDGRVGPAADPALVSAFDRRLLTARFAEVFDRCTAEAHP